MNKRRSGVLFHPTSLPNKYGIGSLGAEAREFVDFLYESKQSLWQVLPLGPTGYGDSPYQSFSSYAGNPLLISIEKLIEEGLISQKDIEKLHGSPICPLVEYFLKGERANDKFVDYGYITYHKFHVLKIACKNFLANGASADYRGFCYNEKHWLENYALFMAVKEKFEVDAQKRGVKIIIWNEVWDADIKNREPSALSKYSKELEEEIEIHKVLQYFFYRDWFAIKEYANSKGIKIIGDIPIFVALDSSDVWANRDLFQIDENGIPYCVAGVPPDYFSATGQLWGNPLYNWESMRKTGFKWWLGRIKHSLKLYDFVRIDHFRGFDAYWEIPYGEETAIKGRWVKAPGRELFETIKSEYPDGINIIAEDLGVITPEVESLRDDFNLPGMKVLQFAFDSGEGTGSDRDNVFLPHNYPKNSIAYSGTHDNDTTLGWINKAKKADSEFAFEYLSKLDENDKVWCFIRGLFVSSANLVVVPMQDLLSQDGEYRMNTPSTLGNNWHYRLSSIKDLKEVAKKLRTYSINYSRNKEM